MTTSKNRISTESEASSVEDFDSLSFFPPAHVGGYILETRTGCELFLTYFLGVFAFAMLE